MTRMIDFTSYPKRNKGYAGTNGNKISIVYNDEIYMLKFSPAPTKNPEMSYTNSCICEYIELYPEKWTLEKVRKPQDPEKNTGKMRKKFKTPSSGHCKKVQNVVYYTRPSGKKGQVQFYNEQEIVERRRDRRTKAKSTRKECEPEKRDLQRGIQADRI